MRTTHISTIGIIGLGYVGLPLAIELSYHYKVIGLDTNSIRIKDLSNNIDTNSIHDKSFNHGDISFITIVDSYLLQDCDVIIVTVPTPITKELKPDFSPIENATKLIRDHLVKNQIIVYESTVYPTATESICVPILEDSGLIYNKDFYLGYSPERINISDPEHTIKNTVKVVSGSTADISNILYDIYSKVFTLGVHITSSIKVAEASKLFENVQRDVNIAVMNEFAIICDKLNISIREVLDACNTKWNFLDFTPGLVGGHCISVDPYYLLHLSSRLKVELPTIQAGRTTNESMVTYAINKIYKISSDLDIPIDSLSIGFLGVSYKPNTSDIRNSKVLELINYFKSRSSTVCINDDFVFESGVCPDLNFRPLDMMEDINILILSCPHDYYNDIIKEKELKTTFSSLTAILDIYGILDSCQLPEGIQYYTL